MHPAVSSKYRYSELASPLAGKVKVASGDFEYNNILGRILSAEVVFQPILFLRQFGRCFAIFVYQLLVLSARFRFAK
jgi:hypothetical protein